MQRKLRNRIYSAWDLLWINVDFFTSTGRSRLSLWWQGCSPSTGFKTSGKCYFKARRTGSIIIGQNVTLLAGQRSNRVGLTNPVQLETLAGGIIEIGNNSGASAVTISSRSRISIGKNVKLGGNVRIFDHDYHSLDPVVRRMREDGTKIRTEPIVIGNDVFIGTNATILKGVTIGDRSIIGAGAVVSLKLIPSDSIAVGNPAQLIK